MTDDEMMKTYLDAVHNALVTKSLKYYGNSQSPKEKFLRMTEIKNSMKSIGAPFTFGIAPSSYSACPGECVGGVCTTGLNITDADLRDLANRLGVSDADFHNVGG